MPGTTTEIIREKLEPSSGDIQYSHPLEKKKLLVILFILLVAFNLRLKGIYFGLPYMLNPDEAGSVLLFLSGGFLDLNAITSILEINPASIYIPLRVISVLFGVGTVLLVYLIGVYFSRLAGILASSFLAVSFLHVKFSQVLLSQSIVVFITMLSLFFVFKYMTSENKEFHNYKKLIITFFVLLFLSNIDLFSIFKSYVEGYYYYPYSSYLLYLFNFLLVSVGPFIWLGAMGLFFYKKEYSETLLKSLFSVPLFYLGLIGLFHLTKIGYAVLLSPFVCLASALTFTSMYKSAFQSSENSPQRFFYIVLVLVTVWLPLKTTLKYNKMASLSDTRVLATEWVKENASGDIKIARDINSLQTSWTDAYDKKRLKSLRIDQDVISDKQEFLITEKFLKQKNWFRGLRKKVDYVVINSYDSEMVLRKPGHSLLKKYYSKIQKLKPEIVFNPYLLEKENKIRSSLTEELLFPFESLWYRERLGPLISVYKL